MTAAQALWADQQVAARAEAAEAKLARIRQLLDHPITSCVHPPVVLADDLRKALE